MGGYDKGLCIRVITVTVCTLSGPVLPVLLTFEIKFWMISGIQTTTCYWPVKVTDLNKVVLFKLQFYDAGEAAIRKFDHVLSVSETLHTEKVFHVSCAMSKKPVAHIW